MAKKVFKYSKCVLVHFRESYFSSQDVIFLAALKFFFPKISLVAGTMIIILLHLIHIVYHVYTLCMCLYPKPQEDSF